MVICSPILVLNLPLCYQCTDSKVADLSDQWYLKKQIIFFIFIINKIIPASIALQEPAQISNYATDNLMIGPRSYPQKKKVMVESLVLQVMGRLQESFYDFKDYCAKIDNAEEDCAILETDWISVIESIK